MPRKKRNSRGINQSAADGGKFMSKQEVEEDAKEQEPSPVHSFMQLSQASQTQQPMKKVCSAKSVRTLQRQKLEDRKIRKEVNPIHHFLPPVSGNEIAEAEDPAEKGIVYDFEKLSDIVKSLEPFGRVIRNKKLEKQFIAKINDYNLTRLRILFHVYKYMLDQKSTTMSIAIRETGALEAFKLVTGMACDDSVLKKLRSEIVCYYKTGILVVDKRGIFIHESALNDEDVSFALENQIKSYEPHLISARSIAIFVNQELVDTFQIAPVSEETVRVWMHRLGFSYDDNEKGFFDGHERSDVVRHRESFTKNCVENIFPNMTTWEYDDDGKHVNTIAPPNPEEEVIWVSHDESTFDTMERSKSFWNNGTTGKKKSTRGGKIMVSQFICPCHGNEPRLRKTIVVGKNADGYWCCPDLIQHLKEVLPILAELHPGKKHFMVFDNSKNHKVLRPDRLNAAGLNVKDGGKRNGKEVALMHDTEFNGVPQVMSNSDGKQKGLLSILQERNVIDLDGKPTTGLMRRKLSKKEMVDILSSHEDFKNEKHEYWIEYEMKKLAAEIGIRPELAFLPTFHPEFNFIELVWGFGKKKIRGISDGTMETLRAHLDDALAVPIDTARRFANKTFRRIALYQQGANYQECELLVAKTKLYKSHRHPPSDFKALVAEELKRNE